MSECYLYVMGHYATKMIYIGVTDDIKKRVEGHKNNLIAGFSSEYKVDLLIYYEKFSNVSDAIEKEQLYQKWKNRDWLLNIIAKRNPLWRDLYDDILIYT
jgi:putative endonuclease